jgi:hypothetical protein
MTFYDLPKHLQDYIYEFDPTYRNKFNIFLINEEFKDILLDFKEFLDCFDCDMFDLGWEFHRTVKFLLKGLKKVNEKKGKICINNGYENIGDITQLFE